MWNWMHGGGFGWEIGMAVMGLFWFALAAAAVWIAATVSGRLSGRAASRDAGAQTPLEILRRRYARGEIDDAEYEQRRKTLS